MDKVILRAVSGNAKKDSRFTLRHIKPSRVCTCADLKHVIRSQLEDEISPDDFDVGYIQGTTACCQD